MSATRSSLSRHGPGLSPAPSADRSGPGRAGPSEVRVISPPHAEQTGVSLTVGSYCSAYLMEVAKLSMSPEMV